MKSVKFHMILAIGLSLLLAAALFGQTEKQINKVFDAKERIKVKLAIGSCLLQKSLDGKIHVNLVYSYDDDNFTPVFTEKGETLILEEKFRGHNNGGGQGKWTVSLPGKADVDLNTGTGDLSIQDLTIEMEGNTGTGDIELTKVKGKVDVNTGTGDIEMTGSDGKFEMNSGTGDIEMADCDGEFEVNSGTGDVDIKDTKGSFDANSGTGDVQASNITIVDDGEFNSGTGDVVVAGPKGEAFTLEINSGTGDATLKMNGAPLIGYFEFTCQEKRGRIVCPIKFDIEEVYEESDQSYLRKSFLKGKDTPRFEISTGTGTARLEP